MDHITLNQLLLVTQMNTVIKVEQDHVLVFAGSAGSAHEAIEQYLLNEEVMSIRATGKNELEVRL